MNLGSDTRNSLNYAINWELGKRTDWIGNIRANITFGGWTSWCFLLIYLFFCLANSGGVMSKKQAAPLESRSNMWLSYSPVSLISQPLPAVDCF